MAAEQLHFMYTGGGRQVIPLDVTHVTVHDSITVIPADLFQFYFNIVELICHDGVIIIEGCAFNNCLRLKRVIIPGVKIIGDSAFCRCEALIFIDCPKLERIGNDAFYSCESLSSINLQSVKVVGHDAFVNSALTDVEFDCNLESLGEGTFQECRSLERISLPLKVGLNLFHSTFTACSELKHVDLVERAVLKNTIDALLMDNWRDDMNSEIAAINQSLPNAYAGSVNNSGVVTNEGDKTRVIREWIGRSSRKIVSYKAQHRRILEGAVSTLQLLLPCDIVLNNIISFLELPPHTFDGEDDDSDESQ